MKRSPGSGGECARQRQHARRVGLQVATQAELLAREHDRDAVVAHRTAHQHASPARMRSMPSLSVGSFTPMPLVFR